MLYNSSECGNLSSIILHPATVNMAGIPQALKQGELCRADGHVARRLQQPLAADGTVADAVWLCLSANPPQKEAAWRSPGGAFDCPARADFWHANLVASRAPKHCGVGCNNSKPVPVWGN